MFKKYLAEFIGTFVLSFLILAAVSQGTVLPMSLPLIAGLTLTLFVYTIGVISGSHINPAITVGLLSIKKITSKEALFYIFAQISAAALAIAVARELGMTLPLIITNTFHLKPFLAEVFGTFVFSFGIAAVVCKKINEQMSGLVIGGSLMLGIIAASLFGSSGILNPAVAFALNSANVIYVMGPLFGSILGFQIYQYLVNGK